MNIIITWLGLTSVCYFIRCLALVTCVLRKYMFMMKCLTPYGVRTGWHVDSGLDPFSREQL